MRPILLTTLLFVSGMALLATGHSAEPARRPVDPWAGVYVKYRRDSYFYCFPHSRCLTRSGGTRLCFFFQE